MARIVFLYYFTAPSLFFRQEYRCNCFDETVIEETYEDLIVLVIRSSWIQSQYQKSPNAGTAQRWDG